MAHGETGRDIPSSVPASIGDLNDVDSDTAWVDKATLVYSTADTELKKVAPSAAITDTAAITGGEAPTEAEFNALLTKFNAALAALRVHGIIT